MADHAPLPKTEDVKSAIQTIRGTRVVLDEDLARFYGKTVSAFNQAVKRNSALFDGYRFQLTAAEVADLQSQDVIASRDRHGGRRSPPWVFTDYGVVIASAIFRDERSIQILRMMTEAFVDAAKVTPISGDVLTPKRDRATVATLQSEDLRALAEDILAAGEQGFLDWVRRHTTAKHKSVAETIKVLAEAKGSNVQAEQQKLRLEIAKRIERRDYLDNADRSALMELIQALKP